MQTKEFLVNNLMGIINATESKITILDYGKRAFILSIPDNAMVLDVGCGNNSPLYTKSLKPNITYIGLDIGDYNQTSRPLADKYIITSPDLFASEIEKLSETVDCVISSHNLEHCIDRNRVVKAMVNALKPNGSIYLSFPCMDSVNFPGSRSGCLNYYDDSSHMYAPPQFW
jgi:2-polyprenyl-3-methyl-5-hydroxy-6-metoxy-1,4-benzoquinol methylase